MSIVFTVPGQAIPWMRARSQNGARFNAPALKEYENTVRMLALAARGRALRAGIRWPLDADAYEISGVIVDADRRRRDVDNVLKSAFDGLTGALWDDDSRVHHVRDVPRIVDATDPRLVIRVRVTTRAAIAEHARELLAELEA
jgi:Holliday junction resolvase RusA-like endonuclease